MKKILLILCLAYQVSQAQETKPTDTIPIVSTFKDVAGSHPVYSYMGRFFIIRVLPNGKTRKQYLSKGLVKTLQR